MMRPGLGLSFSLRQWQKATDSRKCPGGSCNGPPRGLTSQQFLSDAQLTEKMTHVLTDAPASFPREVRVSVRSPSSASPSEPQRGHPHTHTHTPAEDSPSRSRLSQFSSVFLGTEHLLTLLALQV